MSEGRRREEKVARWWFGGVASAGAACIAHPLELLKVIMQTTGDTKKYTFVMAARDITSQQGFYYTYLN